MPSTEAITSEAIRASLLENPIPLTITSGNSSIYEVALDLKNPFAFNWDGFAVTESPMTFESFLELTSDIIARQQEIEGISEDKRVQFIADYPTEEIYKFGDEVVTYRLMSRVPARETDNIGAANRFRWAYEVASPAFPKHKLVVESRKIEHEIDLISYSKSAKLANARALWIERKLIDHTWLYQMKGIDRFFWKGRSSDNFMNVSGQYLYYRANRFTFILNEFRIKAEPILTGVDLEIEVLDNLTLSYLQSVIYKRLTNNY